MNNEISIAEQLAIALKENPGQICFEEKTSVKKLKWQNGYGFVTCKARLWGFDFAIYELEQQDPIKEQCPEAMYRSFISINHIFANNGKGRNIKITVHRTLEDAKDFCYDWLSSKITNELMEN